MVTESISIPAERIPPVGTDMASTSKAVAGVLLFLFAILAIAVLSAPERHPDHHDAAHEAGRVVGALLFAGLPGLFGFRAARNAVRATRAAALAKNDPSYTWRIAGRWIIAADGNGAPRPELSFKVNGKLRTMLLAVPRAEVVDRS